MNQVEITYNELKGRKKEGITSWYMIEKHHITRLSDKIFVLKKKFANEDHNEYIYSEDVVERNPDGSLKNRYTRYWLKDRRLGE